MMKKRFSIFLMLFLMLFAFSGVFSYADGYEVVIEDEANLLSNGGDEGLKRIMEPLTEYGHVIFKSITVNPERDTYSYATQYYYSRFGNADGLLFIVDMDYRKIFLVASGHTHDTITDAKAELITDNVYRYAASNDFYGCAKEAFSEALELLSGGKISEPMRYISNALLSLIVAFLICFAVVTKLTRTKAASKKEINSVAVTVVEKQNAVVTHVKQTRVYSPVQTSSGGHSGGGGGGGHSGGGGGGFSGGGGGHSF